MAAHREVYETYETYDTMEQNEAVLPKVCTYKRSKSYLIWSKINLT